MGAAAPAALARTAAKPAAKPAAKAQSESKAGSSVRASAQAQRAGKADKADKGKAKKGEAVHARAGGKAEKAESRRNVAARNGTGEKVAKGAQSRKAALALESSKTRGKVVRLAQRDDDGEDDEDAAPARRGGKQARNAVHGQRGDRLADAGRRGKVVVLRQSHDDEDEAPARRRAGSGVAQLPVVASAEPVRLTQGPRFLVPASARVIAAPMAWNAPAVAANGGSARSVDGVQLVRAMALAPPAAGAAIGAATMPATLQPMPANGAVPPGSAATSIEHTHPALPHREIDDPLLRANVALVVDQDSHQVLYAKNADAVQPIASITKLMTAIVVVEAGLPMDEPMAIEQEDLDLTAGNRSRLSLGTQLDRGGMLRLALMSSENRAAAALSRYYPGGMPAFVAAMNRKAHALGMRDTRFVEPTGLSSENRSSARDLTVLVAEASRHPLIRQLSTTHEADVFVGLRGALAHFRNTNRLVQNPDWAIGLQKTGYISAAGHCLVLQAQVAGRNLIMILLDSAGSYFRIADAEKLRHWLLPRMTMGAGPMSPSALAALPAGTPVLSASGR